VRTGVPRKTGPVVLGKLRQSGERIGVEDGGMGFGVNAVIGGKRPAGGNGGNVAAPGEPCGSRRSVPTRQNWMPHQLTRGLSQSSKVKILLGRRLHRGTCLCLQGTGGLQIVLCLADQRDHALIAGPAVVIEGNDAVMQQHDALQTVPVHALSGLVDLLGKDKAGHDIGQHQHVAAIKCAQGLLSAGAVADGDHRVCMGVINIAPGHQRMQDSLYRWRRRRRIEQGKSQLAHHVGVR
jgi:hypothetical protein